MAMAQEALAFDWATVRVLLRRDLMRLLRQPSRIIGTLGQPLIFWFVFGSGMASTFRLPGASNIAYAEYFYPGVLVMVLLFASIFATVSVIEDRHAGFLQAVLVGPGSRASLVLGKIFGAMSVALVQVLLLILFAPLGGFSLGGVRFLSLASILLLTSFGLTALGVAMAWWLDNIQAYHAIQMVILVPLWVLSGAMFPLPTNHPAFAAFMRCNPLTYATTGVRQALYGAQVPMAFATPPLWVNLSVMTVFAALTASAAIFISYRRR